MIRANGYARRLAAAVLCLLIAACGNDPSLPRLPGDAVILAFGNSLTRGHGADESESYPAILEELTGRTVINAGISGEVSARGLKRLPGLLDRHRPDLLILCHGGNDILRKMDLDTMAANVRNMIDLADSRGIPVILLGVPEPGLFLSAAEVYDELAKQTGVLYIRDLVPDILGDKSLKSDQIHPNSDGYRAMAESIYAVLEDAGAV